MEARSAAHPAADILLAYGQGNLDNETAEGVKSHLDGCPACRKQVAAAPDDSFLDKLRAAYGSGGTAVPTKSLSGVANSLQPARAAAHSPAVPGLPPELANNQRYEVRRELGRGGMGVVYLARNVLFDRPEVLKVVSKELLDRPEAAERFLREMRSAARLDHLNVVTAYSALSLGEVLVFAMEYVEGEDLAKVVKERGPLPVAEACEYARQSAVGLQHAHEHGMIHRDIKPHNLILSRPGGKQVVKVLDFGLAKATREGEADTALTGAGKMLGTPDYIAPEQTVDAASADIRADIYSLGCTLYFLLTGSPPFKGKSLYQVLQAHKLTDAKPLDQVRADVPVGLAAVVAKMMAKDPAQRYQTPAEASQALVPFLQRGRRAAAVGGAAGPSANRENGPGQGACHESPAAKGQEKNGGRSGGRSDDPGRPLIPKKRSQSHDAVQPAPVLWWKRPAVLVGAACAALALLVTAVVIRVTVKTSDGEAILVVEVDQPGAEVSVDGGKVTVTAPGDNKPVEIKADPGRHKLRVSKDGFEVAGQDIELKTGKSAPVRVRLEPVKAAKPAPPAISRKPHFLSGGHWRVDGGELVQATAKGPAYLLFGDASWTDYDVSFEAQTIEGAQGSGLTFRATDLSSYYCFVVGSYGGRWDETFRIEKGRWVRDVEPIQREFKAGHWYKMRVEARGEQFRCFRDEEMLFAFKDARYPRGQIGLQTWESSMRWKNLKVTAPDGVVLWEGFPELPK